MKISISLIIFTIITTTTDQTYGISNLIETTCKNTPNYRLCINTLMANQGGAATDVAELGLIMVGAVKAKSREALSAVKKLSRNRKVSVEALQRCKDAYEAVVDADVPEAEGSVRGNPKFAENGMADAAVEADNCDGAFGGKSPLSGVNRAVRELAVVARAIIRNLL